MSLKQIRIKCPKCKAEYWTTPGGVIPFWDHCTPSGRTVNGKYVPLTCNALKPTKVTS